MEYRQLGQSGLAISDLGLGTMMWGRDTDEHEARELMDMYLQAGGNFLDTACSDGDGEAERVVGQLIREFGVRHDVCLMSKSGLTLDEDRPVNTSRHHLLRSLETSLSRLRVDYVDVWFVHAWDPYTPLEETLGALADAVTSGKARYVGVSNYAGWQIAKAAALPTLRGTGLISAIESEYSLLNRRIEAEVIPAAQDAGLGVLAWSPLARGVLTGKYRQSIPPDSRGASSHFQDFVKPYLDVSSRRVVDAVATAADGLGLSPTEIALAWVRDQPGITSAIVGARTVAQLRIILAADELELPQPIRHALADVSSHTSGKTGENPSQPS